MPTKKSTRRSISFKAETFERIRRYCEREGVSVAGWADAVLTGHLDHRGEPKVPREEAVQVVRGKVDDQERRIEEARKAAFG